MKRPRRIQTRLVLSFVIVTLLPLGLTLWVSIELLNRSVDLSPVRQFDELSQAYRQLGRDYYRQQRDQLRDDIAHGHATPNAFKAKDRNSWPQNIADFWDSGAGERFELSGTSGNRLDLLIRKPDGVAVYTRDLDPIRMDLLAQEYTKAREVIERAQKRDLRRGLIWTLVAVSGAIWIAGLAALVYWARRIGRPVHELTKALQSVATGDLSKRLKLGREDEIGAAMSAFNDMAAQLQQSREKLIHVTRLASWQALARKTAHEVKNSLTPIRLTMEELIARQDGSDPFLAQAAQIVIDEVVSLERRVRAFSEFASEPPVEPVRLDVNVAVEDRIALLRSANPSIEYRLDLSHGPVLALADPDLTKAVLTNLLENAAHAAGPAGVVVVRTRVDRDAVSIEVHDSGPGLNEQARATLFEPTISFKKGGMGLGLSIARKSALLTGGDVYLIDGELGGAAFRVVLPLAPNEAAPEPELARKGAA